MGCDMSPSRRLLLTAVQPPPVCNPWTLGHVGCAEGGLGPSSLQPQGGLPVKRPARVQGLQPGGPQAPVHPRLTPGVLLRGKHPAHTPLSFLLLRLLSLLFQRRLRRAVCDGSSDCIVSSFGAVHACSSPPAGSRGPLTLSSTRLFPGTSLRVQGCRTRFCFKDSTEKPKS